MKLTVSSVLLALASLHLAAGAAVVAPRDGVTAAYSFESYSVTRASMADIRAKKEKGRENQRKKGKFGKGQYKKVKAVTPCKNGKAGEYGCSNVDLYGFASHQQMGSVTAEGNDIWGWTSPDGRELVAVGQTDGTAFAEVLFDGSVKYLGRLPTQTVNSLWRDMKVVDGYVYIGSEARNHGLQVFDMRKLLTLTSPKVFNKTTDLTAHFTGFGSSHNIVANEATKSVYAVGATTCRGGLHMLDVSNPASPKDVGCASADGYVHDAQCVVYSGPDKAYRGKEICFGFNEDTLTIYDLSNKASPKILSRTGYTGASYTHQGWIADKGMNYLISDDETDEMYNTAPGGNAKTTSYIWDIKALTKPVLKGIYKSQTKSIDHNMYIIDGLAYMSNYASGLRIVDVSSVTTKPDGSLFKEVGFFDVYPEDDKAPVNDFFGAWSVYPYFKSGYIVINSIERGLFSVKYNGSVPARKGNAKNQKAQN